MSKSLKASILVFVCVVIFSNVAESFFTVKDVFIESEDKSSAKAKNKALSAGDMRALSQITRIITDPTNYTKAINLIKKNPSTYISDFSIKEEKITPTRYEAFITYRILKDKLLDFLISNLVQLKPEAGNVLVIKSKDLYGNEAIIEKLTTDPTAKPLSPLQENTTGRIADSEKTLGYDRQEFSNTLKVKVRSVEEWLNLSPVISKFLTANEVFVSSNLIVLEASSITVDDNFRQALNEKGFELMILSDKTIIISPKNPDIDTPIQENESNEKEML